MIVILCIIISLAAVGYLSASDPKRRRIFGLKAWDGVRYTRSAILVIFSPIILLLLIGHYAGFVIWIGCLSAIGWAMVAITPEQYIRIIEFMKLEEQ